MPDTHDLLVRAQQHAPAGKGLDACWSLVLRGIEAGWIDEEELRELLEHLRDHRDFGIEELLFDHIGDRLRVSFLGEQVTCAPAAMIEALSVISGGTDR